MDETLKIMSETLEIAVTPLVARGEDGPRRVAYASLALTAPLLASRILLRSGERRAVHPTPPLPPGRHRLRLELPDSRQEAEWDAELEGRTLRHAFVVAPARRWTIHVVPHSHLDIGYTDRQETVLALHRSILDTLPDLCEATAAWGEARFAWSVEATYPLMDWVRSRPRRQHDRLAHWMKGGQVEITGAAMTSHTDIAAVEGLSRSLYLARDLGEYFGVPVVSAMQTDVEGYTWRLASLLARAGIRYFSAALNHNRSGARPIDPIALGLPWCFRWLGPDARGPLVAYASGYGHALPTDSGALDEYIVRFVADWEARRYPHHNVLLRASGDNKLPDLDVCAAVRGWNERYDSPRLRVSTCGQAFAAIEGEPDAAFPTLQADWPEWWTDGVGAAAREVGLNRRSHRLLPAAEKLHTFALLHDEEDVARYPAEDIARAWMGVNLFDEHTWGAAWPWLDTLRGPASGHMEWTWKAAQAHLAHEESARLVESGAHHLAALTAMAAAATDALLTLMVINPSSWDRTDTVELSLFPFLLQDGALAAEDLATGEIAPVQVLAQGEDEARTDRVRTARSAVFLACDVPAHGYKCFALRPQPGPVAAQDSTVRLRGSTLTTPFHRIVLDPATGTVVDLVDIATGLGWAEPCGGYGLNAFIHEHYNVVPGFNHLSHFVDGTHPAIVLARDGTRSISVRPGAMGPVMWSVLIEAEAPGIDRLHQEIRVYAGVPRIDFINTVRKPETMTKEGAYFAFPIPADDGRVSYSIPGASRGRDDRTIPGSCSAWYAVEDWVAVERERGTLIWVADDAPIVEFGQTTVPYAPFPRYAPTPPPYRHHRTPTDALQGPFPEGCLLFSYAYNNIWDTNFPASQGGVLPFRFGVTTGGTELTAADAPRFAASCRDPLVAVTVPNGGAGGPATGQYLRADRADVRVLAVKRGRDPRTVAVRFIMTSDQGGVVRLTFPGLTVDEAHLTTLVEDSERPCQASGDTIDVPTEPHGVHTVVVRCHRRGK